MMQGKYRGIRRTDAAVGEAGGQTLERPGPLDRWRRPATSPRHELGPLDEVLLGGPAPSTTDHAPGTRRDSAQRRALALVDAVSLSLAYVVAWVLLAAPAPWDESRLVLLGALPLWILLNKLVGLYDRDANLIHKSTLNELPRIAQSISLGAGLIFLLAPPLAGTEIGRGETVVFWAAAMVLTPSLRFAARTAVRRRSPPEGCMIVGSGVVAHLLARKIQAHREYGVEVTGFVDVEPPHPEASSSDVPHFFAKDVSEFEHICREQNVERVVIAFSTLSDQRVLEFIRASKLLNLKISVIPRLFEVTGPSVAIDQVEGMTLLGLRGFSRTRSSLILKRMLDVSVAAVGLFLLSPLLAVLALLVALTSPGRVLYVQRRVGRANEPFKLYKFRTMVDGADELKPGLAHLNEAHGPMFKIADDPRVTRVGRWLRRTSLDELPQLWNVLRGEMSLVGPRPLVPTEDDQVIGWHRARLELTPGLTGPWQVMGRTAIPFDEMIKLDYLYVADWSLWNDVKLLIRTGPVVLQGRGH